MIDDTIEARKARKKLQESRCTYTHKDRTTDGPPKNYAFHERTTDLFSFLAEKKKLAWPPADLLLAKINQNRYVDIGRLKNFDYTIRVKFQRERDRERKTRWLQQHGLQD